MKKYSIKDIAIMLLVFILSYMIFSDWDNFKAGLAGECENVEKVK